MQKATKSEAMKLSKEGLLELVKAAYEKTGLIPVRGTFFEWLPTKQEVCGCPMAAIANIEAKYSWLTSNDDIRNVCREKLGVDRHWLDGFEKGIDFPYYMESSCNPEGFEYGQFVANNLTFKEEF